MYSQYIRNKIHIDILLFLQISWEKGNGHPQGWPVPLFGHGLGIAACQFGPQSPRINDADVQMPAMVDRSFPSASYITV